MKNERGSLVVSSPEFIGDGKIPVQYTADGAGVNPPLTFDGVPEGTQYLALIMEDPDAPGGTFTHWLLWDIPEATSISEHTTLGVSGRNSAGKNGYFPPDPPAETGSHRYYFHVFALDTGLDLKPGAERDALQSAMEGHILAAGTMMARYGRLEEHA
ncbi:MAG TPA: YbhB/YbcL family Raf kinase inhibitor-like protein [Puia sp.]|nr:YbhB/YbcL family Raf kinase inhibitor-like protein [Puia sp.]